jgi:hypothetical protein
METASLCMPERHRQGARRPPCQQKVSDYNPLTSPKPDRSMRAARRHHPSQARLIEDDGLRPAFVDRLPCGFAEPIALSVQALAVLRKVWVDGRVCRVCAYDVRDGVTALVGGGEGFAATVSMATYSAPLAVPVSIRTAPTVDEPSELLWPSADRRPPAADSPATVMRAWGLQT